MEDFNRDEHSLKQTKECSCGEDMKLHVAEDTSGNIHYSYKCKSKRCDNVEPIGTAWK